MLRFFDNFKSRKPPLVPATPEELGHIFQESVSEESVESGARPEKDLPHSREFAVFHALLKVEGPVTMGELARLMGCSGGEATRRVKLSRARLTKRRVGRTVLVSLRR